MIDRLPHSIRASFGVLLTVTAPLYAQDGIVRGRVLDSAGVAIPDADVAIVAAHLLTRSDAQGRFTFSKLAPGQYEVSVRRLGFQPTSVKAVVGALTYSYDIVMMPQDLRVQVPTANFFLRASYGRNPVARRNNTVARLLAATDAKMDKEAKLKGARDLAAAFPQ